MFADSSGLIFNFGLLAICSCSALVLRLALRSVLLNRRWADIALGLPLAATCTILIVYSVPIMTGSFIDLRAAPAILAGAIGGPISILMVSIAGGAARLSVGGDFMIGGTLSVPLYCLVARLLSSQLFNVSLSPANLTPLIIITVASTLAVAPMFFVDQPFARSVEVAMTLMPHLLFWNLIASLTLFSALQMGQEIHLRITGIEEVIAQNKKLEIESRRDGLTGLLNRRGIDHFLESESKSSMGIISVDLNDFKFINDTHGHSIGDLVLQETSERIKSVFPALTAVGRIGGDEFIVALIDPPEAYVAQAAGTLQEVFLKPFHIEGLKLSVRASIGLAETSDWCKDPMEVVRNADFAMYEAKRVKSREPFTFDIGMHQERTLRLDLRRQIHFALEDGQFLAYYMPKVGPEFCKLIGLEALVRWRHPQLGILEPDAFLECADDLGVTDLIDKAVLERVSQDRRSWVSAGYTVPPISVNISARRLLAPGFVKEIEALDPKPGTLSFELVETIMFDRRIGEVKARIEALRALGCGIEIDDFGDGYSSVSSVSKILPDAVKIDRSVTGQILESKVFASTVKSVIGMCDALSIKVVAEGIETMPQALAMKSMGCTAFQGYLFGAPCSARDVYRHFLRKGAPASYGDEGSRLVG